VHVSTDDIITQTKVTTVKRFVHVSTDEVYGDTTEEKNGGGCFGTECSSPEDSEEGAATRSPVSSPVSSRGSSRSSRSPLGTPLKRKEEDVLRPTNPYSASKAAAECEGIEI
jgi:dTDP-D-glucose 4,6-dehydratase